MPIWSIQNFEEENWQRSWTSQARPPTPFPTFAEVVSANNNISGFFSPTGRFKLIYPEVLNLKMHVYYTVVCWKMTIIDKCHKSLRLF